ncbi:efflux RND transporter periplasmic adaptor subunit [Metabacillus sp. Hm71]|uniref:efflux RND transporter periplasmic adaptor subunit n=1 Tax=Metabacillus sp. Hm71 TaxID=3450743 RepID=UPI003F438B0C
MKKKIWISIGVGLIILILIGLNVFAALRKENPVIDTINLEKREITEKVMVPGTLSLSQEDFIYLDPEKGEVSEILVKSGDRLEKGTPLLIYENEQLQLEKEQNTLSIESAYLRINQIKDQIDNLEEKEEDLAKQVGEQEAEEQVEAEKDQLETDLKVADIEARQLLLQKETLNKKLSQLDVKSEIAGTVLSIDEEAVAGISQTPMIHIGNTDEYVVKGVISEYDALKISENQAVVLRSDVIPDKEWKGIVTKVSLLPEQTENGIGNEDSAVQYPIEVSINAKDFAAKPGFKLIMEIEMNKRIVEAVPLEAVKQDGEDYYVYVVEDGKAIRKKVITGATSDEFMEITSGLKNGDAVIINPPDDLQNGMEVTTK